jgi:hypothetical protein
LRVNLLSVSALEDVGYCTLFKRGHVFIYREGADLVEPQLIGDRVDMLYMLRGQPSRYDSTSDEEQEAPKTVVAQGFSLAFREKRGSLFRALAGGLVGVIEPMLMVVMVEWILVGAQGSEWLSGEDLLVRVLCRC